MKYYIMRKVTKILVKGTVEFHKYLKGSLVDYARNCYTR